MVYAKYISYAHFTGVIVGNPVLLRFSEASVFFHRKELWKIRSISGVLTMEPRRSRSDVCSIGFARMADAARSYKMELHCLCRRIGYGDPENRIRKE